MSAEAFLGSLRGFAGQLLAGANPRCVWTPSARYANSAFDRAFSPEFVPPPNVECADIGEFRCTFIPLQVGAEKGVFINAVPLSQPECDPRLARLPEIVRLIDKPDHGITDVHRVIEHLLDLHPVLFSGAMLFVSRQGASFVLVREAGEIKGSRTWARWPLNRLFVNRRACVIQNPFNNFQALAVPFNVAPGQRYVVVATLRTNPELTATERVFLQCIESLLLPFTEARESVRAYALDSIRSEPLTAEPAFVWYGPSGETYERIRHMLERRGWNIWCAENVGELLQIIEAGTADIVILDGSRAANPVPLLRAAHHVGGAFNVPILFFDRRPPTGELEALVERYLPVQATDDVIFRAVKETLGRVPQRRVNALRTAAREFSSLLHGAHDCAELAQSFAMAAKELAGDWASVTLFDHSGNMYAAEHPSHEEPLLDRVPLTLLSGYAVMRSRLDSEFFAEISDDTATQLRLESLAPVSGATLPIADGGRIVGTLVVLSTDRKMHEPEFEALVQLADVGARAFADVQTRVLRDQAAANAYQPLWEQFSIGECDLDAYRGPNSKTSIRIAALDGSRAGITAVCGTDPDDAFETAEAALQELATVVHHWEDVGDAVDAVVAAFDGARGILAGIVNAETSRFVFAASQFPGPVQIPLTGPMPALTIEERRVRGNISIRPRTVTLVYGESSHSIDSSKILSAVQSELRRGARNAVQPLPSLSGNPLEAAFVGITRRSFGAERPDSPGYAQ